MFLAGSLPHRATAVAIVSCAALASACSIRSPELGALVDGDAQAADGPPPGDVGDAHADTRATDTFGWVRCSDSFVPLDDAQAAALVASTAEVRPENATANSYRPSSGELDAYLNDERDDSGQLPAEYNPYFAYVTGGFSGTTDEIIQWAAAKWGIPADWLRAQFVELSSWRQSAKGNLTTVNDPQQYPALSRASGKQVYQTLGIAGIKWNHPDANTVGPGTEPLRWKSTAFAVDYQVAKVRFFFDDPQKTRSSWGDSAYSACDNWMSIGAWTSPFPWGNSAQKSYIDRVKAILAGRDWANSGF